MFYCFTVPAWNKDFLLLLLHVSITWLQNHNHLIHRLCGDVTIILTEPFLKLIIRIDIMNISCEIACIRILWLVYIGSGNGLVPSGNKQLPEPVLYANMWSK